MKMSHGPLLQLYQCRSLYWAIATVLLFYGGGLWLMHRHLNLLRSQTGTNGEFGFIPGSSSRSRISRISIRTEDPGQSSPPQIYDKFIVYDNGISGQGTGNLIAGLLAAHLLGKESNRTVCVGRYDEFHLAFEPRHKQVRELCQTIVSERALALQKGGTNAETNLLAVNYFPRPPSECLFQRKLLSDARTLTFSGNTYPRWPPVPDRFFDDHYQPTAALLESLPYSVPPKIVVHLREGDGDSDTRKGLDDASLHALGKLLMRSNSSSSSSRSQPRDDIPYLVTNKVSFYQFFEHHYGWKNPNWNEVHHSALAVPSWGAQDESLHQSEMAQHEYHERHILRMWADWYTLLHAKEIYHTHSDFSISAIHWNNIQQAKEIEGIDAKTGALILNDESWVIDFAKDGVSVPIVDRRVGGVGPYQLRGMCSQKESRSRGLFAKLSS